MMPFLIAALIGGLVQAASTLVGRVLIALGITWVAYEGIDVLMTSARDAAIAQWANLGQVAVYAGVLQVGTVVNILSSAWVAAMTVRGLSGGTLKAMVQK